MTKLRFTTFLITSYAFGRGYIYLVKDFMAFEDGFSPTFILDSWNLLEFSKGFFDLYDRVSHSFIYSPKNPEKESSILPK
jgi:hypothetical protein